MTRLCECGCGRETRVSPQSDRSHGYVRGQPRRFVLGHSTATGRRSELRGARHPNYKGGTVDRDGYRFILGTTVPKREHALVVERALGKPLRRGAVIHHVNGDGLDNRPENLVVCENSGYHQYLHARQRAYDATGNANARLCTHCHKWDDPARLVISQRRRRAYHPTCKQQYERDARARRVGGAV